MIRKCPGVSSFIFKKGWKLSKGTNATKHHHLFSAFFFWRGGALLSVFLLQPLKIDITLGKFDTFGIQRFFLRSTVALCACLEQRNLVAGFCQFRVCRS